MLGIEGGALKSSNDRKTVFWVVFGYVLNTLSLLGLLRTKKYDI